MKKTWYQQLVKIFSGQKRVFVMGVSNKNNIVDILSTVKSNIINSKVDVFMDCESLFLALNKHKHYYQVGILEKSDTRNTAGVFANMVRSIDPNIKIVTYSDKNTFKKEISV